MKTGRIQLVVRVVTAASTRGPSLWQLLMLERGRHDDDNDLLSLFRKMQTGRMSQTTTIRPNNDELWLLNWILGFGPRVCSREVVAQTANTRKQLVMGASQRIQEPLGWVDTLRGGCIAAGGAPRNANASMQVVQLARCLLSHF